MDIGEQIKYERKRRNITLKVLAELVKCSPNYLSLIEKNKVNPSAKVLRRLFDILEMQREEYLNDNDEQIFVKKEKRTRIVYPNNKVIRELLVKDPSNKLMEPAYKIIPVNSDSNGWHRHKGEEFGYILNGKLELRVADEVCVLEKGDSFYFSSSLMHYYKNVGDCDVETIWIVAPPSSFKYLFLKKH
ncbi:MAG: helix-turn-helix domain-containing protein [Desulfurella sp.]|uniref:helix-turn-helix domain-containing protein n=1 Tax=Desulfurella sp. TaxID=1962857 RepID=UPI003D0AE3C4